MDCKSCCLGKAKFRCERCLQKHLLEHRSQVASVSKIKLEYVQKAKMALEKMTPARVRRATKAAHESILAKTEKELNRVREENETMRTKLAQTLERHEHRRRMLSQAYLLAQSNPPTSSPKFNSQPPRATLEALHRTSIDMSAAISRARYGLVRELIEVFDIVEVRGRPSLAGRPGIKGEWNIVGSVLPVPGDIRRYPPEQINATVQHTLHFLNILTYYLGVKLPFQVHWKGPMPSIGLPSITAAKGSEHGGWAKWTEDYTLHLEPLPNPSNSAVPPQPPQPPSIVSDRNNQTQTQTPHESNTDPSSTANTQHLENGTSFTTGLTMLLYNVAYLAHTQGVDVELSQSGEVLRNLWAVCCSPELGKRSHATKSQPLLPPTPPTFPLDFNQLLQTITAKPPPGRPGSGMSTSSSKYTAGNTRHGHGKKDRKEDAIPEEEEWDLI